jgi:drug/metabolite transporter (DMT)-like permease
VALAAIAGFTIVCYTAFALLLGKAAGRIDASVSTFVLNGIGAVLPLVYYAASRWGFQQSPIPTSARGLWWSVAAGFAIGGYSVGMINVIARGGVSYSLPVIYGMTIVLGAIASVVLLGEKLSGMHIVGIVVTAAGAGIVALAHR